MVHQARKRFGQNFLHDESVLQRIADATGVGPGDDVIEIGPGRGALTEFLLSSGARVTAVELDRDLLPILRARFFNQPEGQLTLIEGDALKVDFNTLTDTEQPLHLVGNLPYNISTPLIFHLLRARNRVASMHFMLQKEVVERMAAAPGTRDYGRLSVMVQYQCHVESLFIVPPGAFTPRPKVDSAVVRLVPRTDSDYPDVSPDHLSTLVRLAFSQRRKTLRNNLKRHIDLSALETVGIDGSARPETLSVADYVSLANAVSEIHH
ncbi:MAG: 16S rRNA (adenine(1518)-N(6)/adenine(1519)-N(6))-dimethyltransferase RsmA [Natronospirillum sp.]|uniref:16S rRNA (adenine(1518)-N(6)/adenine(1519)-N(6))- dimethyltransferase RsmA n=1 Tax=Natronospirillum sp. TaxID=2812955 RepID=UPI0025EDEBEC|nr:16S rRNA (adenine(1518)-N(6)/adenine(1519)-N(6))-dimethyltransferase RsmA [Natronospirillum sp.]MCH8552588.1 16S rRNA (adenine(1518)-N(6)/adenine(1519)-N(6))-dimethyltransferase RsmA [Natronospirillum sp.]